MRKIGIIVLTLLASICFGQQAASGPYSELDRLAEIKLSNQFTILDKAIDSLEFDYAVTHNPANLVLISKKRAKKEVFGIFGSKVKKRMSDGPVQLGYITKLKQDILNKQKALETDYSVVINFKVDEATQDYFNGLGILIYKSFAKDDDAASNNWLLNITAHYNPQSEDITFTPTLSQALLQELGTNLPLSPKNLPIGLSNTEPFIAGRYLEEEVEAFFESFLEKKGYSSSSHFALTPKLKKFDKLQKSPGVYADGIRYVLQAGVYYFNKVEYEGEKYTWNASSEKYTKPANANGPEKSLTPVAINKGSLDDYVNVFQSGLSCSYLSKVILWNGDDESSTTAATNLVSRATGVSSGNWDSNLYKNISTTICDGVDIPTYQANYNMFTNRMVNPNDMNALAKVEEISALIGKLDRNVIKTYQNWVNGVTSFNNYHFLFNYPNTTGKLSVSEIDGIKNILQTFNTHYNTFKVGNFSSATALVNFVNNHFTTKADYNYVTTIPFQTLSLPIRKQMLNQLAAQTSLSNRLNVGDDYENLDVIQELLVNANEEDAWACIEDLENTDKLFHILEQSSDLLYFIDGNNKLFSDLVGELAYRKKNINTDNKAITDLLIEKNQLLFFDNTYLGNSNKESYNTAQKKITFTVDNSIIESLAWNGTPLGNAINWLAKPGNSNFWTGSQSLKPLDLVAIIPISNVLYNGMTLEKGAVYVLPAVTVYRLFKNDTKAALVVSTRIAMNLALTAVSAGALGAALNSGSALAILAETADITLGMGASVINEIPEVQQNSPTFTKYFNRATLVYGLARCSYAVYTSVKMSKNLKNVFNYFKDKLTFLGAKPKPNTVFDFSNFSNTQDVVDIVLHYKNGKYVVSKEGDLLNELDAEQLASVISNVPINQPVRLLSCNDLAAAEVLSVYTKRPFYASDGWVDYYVNGQIRSQGDFYLFENGVQNVNNKLVANSTEINGVRKVRLGYEASVLTKVVLGSEDLSQFAINFRKTLPVPNHKGNIAVFEYLDNSGNIIKMPFTTFESGPLKGIHSERIADEFFKDNNIPKSNVIRIYSELEPCELASKCKELLQKDYKQAAISYSYHYPGGVDNTIRTNSINQRFDDLINLLK